MVVPTGIGCAIGGFAGDALPSARLLAAASGCLITHPNVMNGAALYWRDPRIHYVEGYGLITCSGAESQSCPASNHWPAARCRYRCGAGPATDSGGGGVSRHPWPGDRAGGDHRSTAGCLPSGGSGAGWGVWVSRCVARAASSRPEPQPLPVARFLEDAASDDLAAIAPAVASIPAGAAVISHLPRHLQIPCAHALALALLVLDPYLIPVLREELGYTFLACVCGSVAPDRGGGGRQHSGGPARCRWLPLALGGRGGAGLSGAQGAADCGGQWSVLQVTAQTLGLSGGVLPAASHAEAAGLVLALREGISPAALQWPPSVRSLV